MAAHNMEGVITRAVMDELRRSGVIESDSSEDERLVARLGHVLSYRDASNSLP